LCDSVYLHQNEMTVISPKEFHRFEALYDTVAFEIYWVELDKNDIDREDHGGIVKSGPPY
jgi:hypothetical protein